MKIRTAIFGVYVAASAVGLAVLMAFILRDVRLRYVQTTEGNWTVGEMRFDTRKGSKR